MHNGAISLWTSRLPWLIAQPAIVRSFFGRLPALFRIQLLPFAYLLVEKPLPPAVARGPSSFYRSWDHRLHHRRRCLRPADARTLLILTVRFGAGCVLRGRVLRFNSGCASLTASGCVLRTGGGCVLRTASASISSSSALVFVLSLIGHLRDR